MEHSLKELPFLDILIKNVNSESQISTTNQQTPNNTSTSKATPTKNCIKSIPYTLARRVYKIITDKNLRKYALKNYTQSYTRENIQQH